VSSASRVHRLIFLTDVLWFFKRLEFVVSFCGVLSELLQERIPVLFLSYRIKKVRVFLVLIVLKRLFPKHVRKMFGEISVST
jgi:hypothetical protein